MSQNKLDIINSLKGKFDISDYLIKEIISGKKAKSNPMSKPIKPKNDLSEISDILAKIEQERIERKRLEEKRKKEEQEKLINLLKIGTERMNSDFEHIKDCFYELFDLSTNNSITNPAIGKYEIVYNIPLSTTSYNRGRFRETPNETLIKLNNDSLSIFNILNSSYKRSRSKVPNSDISISFGRNIVKLTIIFILDKYGISKFPDILIHRPYEWDDFPF